VSGYVPVTIPSESEMKREREGEIKGDKEIVQLRETVNMPCLTVIQSNT
jgi:hypothetical protein